jgi:lipid-A-disaccharide synthase
MDVLIVAGEASGDQHGALLWRELKSRDPRLRGFGLGGEGLRAAGCETLADSSEIAVVGLFEVLKILRRARQIFATLVAEVEKRGAKAAILIDSPDFNLRLARELKKRGVFVVYYISPQLWAWRKGRIRAIKRDVDLMLVLFPFEVEFYRSHGVDAVHVGHPLVDEVPRLDQLWDRAPLKTSEQTLRLALLPGSRRSELKALLPTMLATVRQIAEERPVEALLIQAPILPDSLFDAYLDAAGPLGSKVKLERSQ